MEECPDQQLVSPRISFSHDLAAAVAAAAADVPAAQPASRYDASLIMSWRRRRRGGLLVPEEFDFANAAAAADDVAPADRLFAGGKLLPMPPLPPTARAGPASPCAGHHAATGGCAKRPQLAAAWQQQRSRQPRSWTSPFSRSSSVNSAATTTTTTAPPGRFTCPFRRSRSANSAARDGSGSGSGASVFVTAAGQRPHSKKVGGGAAAPAAASGGGARPPPPPVYYYGYGGGRNGGISSSHGGGVRVSPVLNVTSIGTSVVNLLSYLLCDCGDKTTKSRGFRVNC